MNSIPSLIVFCSMMLWLFVAHTICWVMAMSENDRLGEYAKRNHTWPIQEMVPNTPGWDKLMRRRIRQVEALSSEPRTEKYDAWISVMTQAITSPNFTAYGWGVTRAPPDLLDEFQAALKENFENAYEEGEDVAIVGNDGRPLSSLFVPLPDLIERALDVLQAYHEAWTGIPLQKQKGYGLRLYKNTSRLYMHVDQVSTHVISSIFHIDRSDDAKPWPLVIEDFAGVTQKVYLEKGDILFYESAKCLHGRPIPFEGSWYTSLFLHYSPLNDWIPEERLWEPQYAIPEHWPEQLQRADHQPVRKLEMVDTAMIEPECPNQWCFSDSITNEWRGPAVYGKVSTAHRLDFDLEISHSIGSNADEDEL